MDTTADTFLTADMTGPIAAPLNDLIDRQRAIENATGVRWGGNTQLLATEGDATTFANGSQVRSSYIASYGIEMADRHKPITVEQANRVLRRDRNLPTLIIRDDATPGVIRWLSPAESSWHSDHATTDPVGDLSRAVSPFVIHPSAFDVEYSE